MEISTSQAFDALRKAIAKAEEIKVSANIFILDTAGHQKAFIRMDDAYLGSIDIAHGKAKTAMLFRMPSHEVGEFLKPEAGTYGIVQTSGGLVGFKGGVPVKSGDSIVAYIGVSGGSPDQDFEIATAGSKV
ncbi:GlcG/HbpS family heme-binding protein [Flavobacterium sp. F52]|uniref:GlcG/HbpS family heme-binding protein n=1 Tax=Flavobacterium sp. F52 TaxID=1202532 RepID=UPI000272D864|nr:heme-binding protein [Flavobacterium sp. F52]EJG03171.1 hypothetical protein FF52_03225 [Flavobacterium sp. F52]